MRWRIDLAYDGRPYGGWQYQKPAGGPVLPSVQGTLAQALSSLLGGVTFPPAHIYASGRTDAGVHAAQQVVHVDIEKPCTAVMLHNGLNANLPPSIRVRNVVAVDAPFHARHSACWRAYRYVLVHSRVLRPDLLGRVGHVRPVQRYPGLNVAAMQAELAAVGLGEHDFSGLRDAECQSTTPLCRILAWRVFTQPDALGEPQLIIEISADHFLHHMVRNLVGLLVAVGQTKKPAGELARVLAARTRTAADVTFKPDGLYLWKIGYSAFNVKDLT
jgi:tRNA pseudouridine38-40 synthase